MTDVPQARELLKDNALRRLLAALEGEGAQTRVVGGAVRNALLGVATADIDCASTLHPREVMGRAQAAGLKVIPTGLAHGTVTVIVDGRPFEITTLRVDTETDGRHAQVQFGTDFAQDARRRDFTVNALYLDAQGKIYDYVGGLADIKARYIRFIGDAAARIREDYLRILRFFRFTADYGEGIDAAGFSACIRERAGLQRLSRERVRAEGLRILVSRRAVEIVEAMTDAGILTAILGGVAEQGRFARVAASSSDGLLRLNALAVAIPEDAERLRERLRLSNSEYERLAASAAAMAHLHGRLAPIDERALRGLAIERGLPAIADALAVLAGEPVPQLIPSARALLARYRAGVESVPAFSLTGKHAAAAGIAPGPRMGAVLQRARCLWLAADCPADEAVLAELLRQAAAAVP